MKTNAPFSDWWSTLGSFIAAANDDSVFRTEDLIKAERFGSFVVPTQYQDEVVGFVQQLAEAKHEKCIDLRIMRARYRLDQMLRAAKRSDPLFVIVPA